MDCQKFHKMSDREMHFIKILKRWVIGLAGTTLIAIVSGLLLIWQTDIVNATKMETMQKTMDTQQSTLNSKASLDMVKTVKTDIEKEIDNKFETISGKLDIVLQMLPMTQNNNYNFKGKVKTK